MDDLLQEFIAETRETLDALSGEIVAWEIEPKDRSRLDAIFRFVHTVKGSCGFLDLPRLARLSHAAEDVLAAVRSGERTPDPALVTAVLAIVDRIGEIVEAIDSGVALDDSGEDLLIAALDAGAEAAAPAAQQTPTSQRVGQRSVRLSTELLDRMMSGMSDMVLARNELARRMRDQNADPAIEAALDRLSLTVAEMRDTVTRTRMQKVDALFSALPRMVRDTAAEVGKSVQLVIEGADVELDREMIEMMRDPLVHIIRNSIDHGIESAAQRRAAGKRETGRLVVSARQSGNQIIIEIADDGRGIDTDRLVKKLTATGQSRGRDLSALSERAKLDLIFEPGLSTKDEVTAISGRGVGMDVVRANIEQIGGRIELVNARGRGLRILIHVPLTLSIIPAIVIGIAGQRFAVTRQAIEEIVRVAGDSVRIDRLGDTAAATVRDRRMPLVDLGALLGIAQPNPTAADMLAIISASGGSFAVAVDSVLDHEELVIKPAAPAVMATGIYAGQTLPDSGSPMLLLDCAGIAAEAGIAFSRDAVAEDESLEAEVTAVDALLFEDLDGRRRAVPLAIVDRVETVPADTARFSGGRMRLLIEGRIVPLAALGEIAGRAEIAVLRIKDGDAEVAYAIAEAVDIVAIPAEIVPSAQPGPILGVVTIDDEQIELIDPQWLLGPEVGAAVRPGAPLCLIEGEADGWIATFLKPVLEAAGYRVATYAHDDDRPAVILTTDPAAAEDARVVRLSNDRRDIGGEGQVYRYDRAGLLAAVARRVEAA
ncbi:chemotaxis protein CheA [Sphingomonas sp.]|jgi:two-component system chemotaxis sensor kinase CheA|uniref:chemotaxis protein CheA n=1 Tax=Sphingomonas sp. TaxID=28214 RepID=UPI002E339CCD|nr:chemotaxis protein CheW [Sphingomonas sp.]HEX4693909.1 chemotaxis protein CheW [Sphingomonas sp.]